MLFSNTHLIRNNVIHVSHMFLMKLNLEECGLWWEAAMICEVCVRVCVCGGRTTGGWEPAGGFSLLHSHDALNLFTYRVSLLLFLSQLYTHLLARVFFKCVYMSISMFVQKLTCMQYLLLAATMYMAKYLHVSQAFRPSLVPTVRPLTHGSQPILSSYRMRQCRTWGG